MKSKKTPEERFWSRVVKGGPDECWPWVGANTRGYGILSVNDKNTKSTRFSWALHHGVPFPEHLDCCHTCDNPPCVNPAHLFPGTASDNAKDAVAKGRVKTPTQRGFPPGNAGIKNCKRGHEFTPENTLITPQGRRSCRTCVRMHKRAYEARVRNQARALTPKPEEKP